MPKSNTMPQDIQLLPGQHVRGALYFYQKTNVLYQMTVAFCRRFLPPHGDRTVDQMVQAARSGKQNIAEGLADGVTSAEMQLKLLNVARASIQELQEDYQDYLTAHCHGIWTTGHTRYDTMLAFCRTHNMLEEYQPFFERWSDEEMANTGVTLCRMTDKMMTSFMQKLGQDFVTQGGFKERMYQSRTGYRKAETEELHTLRQENTALKEENTALRQELARLKERLEGV